MMKKLFIFCVCCLFAFSLTACSQKELTKDEKEVDLATNISIIKRHLNEVYADYSVSYDEKDWNIVLQDDLVSIGTKITLKNNDIKQQVSFVRTILNDAGEYKILYLQVGNKTIFDNTAND